MKVLKPHGIHGCVKVVSYAEDPHTIIDKEVYILRNDVVEKKLRVKRVFGIVHSKCIVALDGVDSVEQAEELRSCMIAIPRAQLPQVKDDEYYWTDLIGYSVIDTDGNSHGKIKSIEAQLGGDVAFVETPGKPQQCILLVQDWVAGIDRDKEVVIVKKEFWNKQHIH